MQEQVHDKKPTLSINASALNILLVETITFFSTVGAQSIARIFPNFINYLLE